MYYSVFTIIHAAQYKIPTDIQYTVYTAVVSYATPYTKYKEIIYGTSYSFSWVGKIILLL